MSGMGSVCKSMPEQSLIHEQEVQANMRSLQQPRGQPSQPGKYAFGLKCYSRRPQPQPRPLFLVRDGVFSQPLFDKIKNTLMTCINYHILWSIFKSLFYNHGWFLEPWNREKSLTLIWHCIIESGNLLYGTTRRKYPIIWRKWRNKNQFLQKLTPIP